MDLSLAFSDLVDQYGQILMDNSEKLIISILFIVVVSILYKYISRMIDEYGAKLELEAHVVNALRLLLRVGAMIAGFTVIFNLLELPSEWFVGSSALIGAFLGFGSSQTINKVRQLTMLLQDSMYC